MRNVLDMEKYMAFGVEKYLKEACQIFAGTNPSIGSGKLAHYLLDHAFLKMCGHLEQKLTNMAWFIGYHDIENAKDIHDIKFYQNKLDIKSYNALFKLCYVFLNKKTMFKNGVYEIDHMLKSKKNLISETVNSLNYKDDSIILFNFTGSKHKMFMKTLPEISDKGSFKKDKLETHYKEVEGYRNEIAHNKTSIYSREFCSLNNLPKHNIYRYMFVISSVDKTIIDLFQELNNFINKRFRLFL